MSLFMNVKNLNLRVYDVRSEVNLNRLRPEFTRLAPDPYVPEGFRRKHILWVNHHVVGQGRTKRHEYDLIDKSVLYQGKDINPVHGGIERAYPRVMSWKTEHGVMKKLLDVFVHEAKVPDGSDILLQFQRVTCEPGKKGKPSVEGWHVDGVDHIGVVCVDRENINGGMSQFKSDKECFQTELAPGYMVVFKDDAIMHRVTDIESDDGVHTGYRDVILMANY